MILIVYWMEFDFCIVYGRIGFEWVLFDGCNCLNWMIGMIFEMRVIGWMVMMMMMIL